MKIKQTMILIFFILAGVVTGSLIANLGAQIPLLSWLAYGTSVGISPNDPFVLDLAILKLSFGFVMSINTAQIICISLALLCYKQFGRKI